LKDDPLPVLTNSSHLRNIYWDIDLIFISGKICLYNEGFVIKKAGFVSKAFPVYEHVYDVLIEF